MISLDLTKLSEVRKAGDQSNNQCYCTQSNQIKSKQNSIPFGFQTAQKFIIMPPATSMLLLIIDMFGHLTLSYKNVVF